MLNWRERLYPAHNPRVWGSRVPAAIAVLGVLFAVLGGALLPHDHAPDDSGHRCVFCQIDAVSGGAQTTTPATEPTTLPPTGERVVLENPSAPVSPAPPAGRLRDPPQA